MYDNSHRRRLKELDNNGEKLIVWLVNIFYFYDFISLQIAMRAPSAALIVNHH